jgi:hypothetical protein
MPRPPSRNSAASAPDVLRHSSNRIKLGDSRTRSCLMVVLASANGAVIGRLCGQALCDCVVRGA